MNLNSAAKLAILERTFSPSLSAPVAYDHWMQVNHALDGCLEARQVHWLYSLVAVNGDRSICLFKVPYVETIREACRQARMPFQRVWQADLWLAEEPQNFSQGTSLIVAEVNYDPPITRTIYEATKWQAKGCLDELNIQSAFSIIALDGTHSACIFSATSAEEVRSLYRKVGIPFERVWKGTLIQPIIGEG
ncbi:hypothetical protein [Leptothermofonsia sp. ETS-13]|uniref:hypothetical protein n=1 Tax=Leptothermofonsia sp. ETS-13 TaxID=3035696 RepID=UPI003B9F5F63